MQRRLRYIYIYIVLLLLLYIFFSFSVFLSLQSSHVAQVYCVLYYLERNSIATAKSFSPSPLLSIRAYNSFVALAIGLGQLDFCAAAVANLKSLSISDTPKPPEYELLEGTPGIIPGHGL